MLSELEVFTEALKFTDPGARAEYLDRVCGADQTQRRRLNELLKCHDSVDSVLDRRPQDVIDTLHGGDATPCDPCYESPVTQLALKPFLEPATHPGSQGRLSHYELLEVLGQGGYGIVFKALDTRLNRLVAVKILSPHLAATSPPRRRFLREARAAAAVRHENVVQIYDVEETPLPYLVMEFISGETLQQRSDRLGSFQSEEVVRFGRQIARGLAAAHAQGLIHRDIKPCNILVSDGVEPVAKLTDFGLARTADDASRSQSGVILGTPMYMSPEQVSGVELDQRADLFSLGSVLYLMAAGRPPFRATNTVAVLRRVVEDKPRSIRDVIPDVASGLCRVIARLHAKTREQRFATAEEVEAALAVCLTQPSPGIWKIVTRAAAVLLVLGLGLVVSENTRLTRLFPSAVPGTDQALAANGPAPAIPVAGPAPEIVAPVAAGEQAAPVQMAVAAASANDQQVVQESDPVNPPQEVVELTDWDSEVGRLSPEEQLTAVRARMRELNPGFEDDWIKAIIEEEAVKYMLIEPATQVQDLSPLRALRQLRQLRLSGGEGKLRDLSPLKGLPLESLEITGHPITDLSPLRGMPLTTLGLWLWKGQDISPLRGMKLINVNLGGGELPMDLEPLRGMPLEMACFNYSHVDDLSPLEGMPLRRLEIMNTDVSDLTPLRKSPLEFLALHNTRVTDLSPLRETRVNELRLDYAAERDESLLRSLPLLQKVNGREISDFLTNP